MAMTQVELDKVSCRVPGCNHDHDVLFLRSRCHMSAPTWTAYDTKTGTIRVTCSVCKSIIAEIAVAER